MLAPLRDRGCQTEFQHLDESTGMAIGYVYESSYLAPGQTALPAWRAESPVVALIGSLYASAGVSEDAAASSPGSVAAISALYEHDAESFPGAGLDGYFCLALWDAARRRIVLTNDRLGNRSFYYFVDESRSLIIFASELKAILKHPAVTREVDKRALAAYLSRGYVPAPLTIFKRIFKSTPGQAVWFGEDGLRSHNYWRAKRLLKDSGDLDSWAELSRERITAAIVKVSRQTPRIGVQLSGGVDSSIVAAVLAEAGKSDVECLTIAWPSVAESQDAAWSAKVAAQFGFNHTILEVGPSQMTPELVSKLLIQFDEPVDSAARAIGLYSLSEAAHAAGLDSIIDGNDSEQLFSAASGSIGNDVIGEGGSAAGAGDEESEQNLLSGRYFSFDRIQRLLNEPPIGLIDLLRGFVHDFDDLLPVDDPSEAAYASYFLRTPMGRYGAFSDLIPRLSGVESRRGFRDYDLFEFSRTIPNEIKGSKKAGTSRQLLKAAFGAAVPAIIERSDEKGTPGTFLAAEQLLPAFLDLAKRADGIDLFRPNEVDRLVRRFLEKPQSAARERFRTLAMFLVWHAFYIEKRDPFQMLKQGGPDD